MSIDTTITLPGLSEGEMMRLASFTDGSDFADFGQAHAQARQVNSWILGDIVAAFDFKVGRPKKGEEAEWTQGALADAWGFSDAQVGQWGNTSAFFPRIVRTRNLSWSIYNTARVEATKLKDLDGEEQLETAIGWLDVAEKLHLTTARQFQNYVQKTYFEGKVHIAQLPAELRMYVPVGETDVWMSFGRFRGEE